MADRCAERLPQMDSVSSSSTVVSSAVPSAVDAFGGAGSSLPPQAGEAVLRQNRPTSDDSPHDKTPQPEGNTISPESVDDSAEDFTADLPADDFDFAGEISKSLANSMRFFTGPSYVPAKRILCKLVGTLLTETLIALDDAMSAAVESEHYNPNIGKPAVACGEGEGVAADVIEVPRNEAFVVTIIDDEGREKFDELVCAMEGESDATPYARKSIDQVRHDAAGTQFRTRVYEVASVKLTGVELTK